MQMMEKGVQFRTLRVENWFDCGRRQSLLVTNRILLENLEELDDYEYMNSVIIHPVKMPRDAISPIPSSALMWPLPKMRSSTHSIVRNSILGAFSTLEGIILNNSVIGNDTTLRGKSTSVNIGDNTEIDFDE